MRVTVFLLTIIGMLHAQPYTRGVGVYPGDPAQDFAAALVPDTRNVSEPGAAPAGVPIERLRLQPDRATGDGRHPRHAPAAVGFGFHQRWGAQERRPRACARRQQHHHGDAERIERRGSRSIWWAGTGRSKSTAWNSPDCARWRTHAGPPDGRWWSAAPTTGRRGRNWAARASAERPPAGSRVGDSGAPSTWPGFTVPLSAPARSRRIRIELSAPSASRWTIGEVILRDKGARGQAGGPYHFTSAWMSARHWRGVGVRGSGRVLHLRPRGARTGSGGRPRAQSRSPTTPRPGRPSSRSRPPVSLTDDLKLAARSTAATSACS